MTDILLPILVAFMAGMVCSRLLTYEKQDKVRNKVLNMYPLVMRNVWLDRQTLHLRRHSARGQHDSIQTRLKYLDDILHRYEQAMVDAEQASKAEWSLQYGDGNEDTV